MKQFDDEELAARIGMADALLREHEKEADATWRLKDFMSQIVLCAAFLLAGAVLCWWFW